MARKNISIGINTWNDLAALGRFGQTFDDIIRILLAEHEELKRIKGTSPSPLQQNQPQSQPSPIESAKTKTKSNVSLEEETPSELHERLEEIDNDYQLFIPGLYFPIDKKRLLKIMNIVHDRFNKKFYRVPLSMENALFLIEKLGSDKEYRNLAALKHDCDILVNDKKIAEKLIGVPKRIPGCRITRLDNLSQLDDERMKRMLTADDYDRRRYIERKQQYEKKQPSEAQLTKA